MTAYTSSRWAGAITRTVEDQYRLGLRGVRAEAESLAAAVSVITSRCAVPVRAKDGRFAGYRRLEELHAKTRRLAALTDRLDRVHTSLDHGRPTITVGGKRLWRRGHDRQRTGLTGVEWREHWEAARMFFTADGETGKASGNETIRVTADGRVGIKVPAHLVAHLGAHLQLAVPVRFTHRSDTWATKVEMNAAVRYDVSYDPARQRWYLDASWTTPVPLAPTIATVTSGRVVGVDLNADHFACAVLDQAGNVVGQPATISLELAGLTSSQRDGRLRTAITALLDFAQLHRCPAIAVENLNFAAARAIGRETMGRAHRGKRFRRIVAGIPTAKFRDRLVAMADHRDIWVVAVDPAYTSRWGAAHWKVSIQQQTSTATTGHHAAAVAIARRGKRMPIRRRRPGPRNGQRTVAGQPATRPNQQRAPLVTKSGSAPPDSTKLDWSGG